MQKEASHIIIGKTGVLTPKERAAVLLRTRGSWKRPLKQSLATLARIRRGWERNIL